MRILNNLNWIFPLSFMLTISCAKDDESLYGANVMKVRNLEVVYSSVDDEIHARGFIVGNSSLDILDHGFMIEGNVTDPNVVVTGVDTVISLGKRSKPGPFDAYVPLANISRNNIAAYVVYNIYDGNTLNKTTQVALFKQFR